MSRWTIAFGLLVLGCGGQYDIAVTNAGAALDDDDVTKWELAVLRGGCPEIANGADPDGDSVVRTLTWDNGEEPRSVGSLEPGRYGFYVRVFDACGARWAACAALDAQAGGSGDVRIALEEAETPVCDDASACTRDTCDHPRGCLNTPLDGDGDGIFCDEDCDDDVFGPGCDDGDPCTEDVCDDRVCSYPAIDADEDGVDCADDCDDQQPDRPDCDDGDDCTDDSCDDEAGCVHSPIDADEDGVDCADDCDDQDPAVNPDAYEVCNDEDDDCDGEVDDGFACGRKDDDCRDLGNELWGFFLSCQRPVSWEEAIAVCDYHGGVLASGTPAVNPDELPAFLPDDWWTAVNDRASEGEWVDYDREAVVPEWRIGQPTNGPGENCAALHKAAARLSDELCTDLFASLCRMP